MASTYSRHSVSVLIAASCLVAASIVGTCLSYVRDVYRGALDTVGAFAVAALRVFKRQAPPVPDLTLLRVAFVRAKAFVLRLAKRNRPVVHPDWRMCPST